ncbi:MAG: hypothetical protein H6977_13075 [Gammaproteobacteria bacterium]|nr:hypothetical protein [Gammaproteobacteria bacterium]MCP5200940.1 hypothetical protein [Gammaproteobacteria bacterium]
MSRSFMERARALAARPDSLASAVVALPLACAAPQASAAALALGDLLLEESYVGYWNASGFFTEVGFVDNETSDWVSLGSAPDGASIGGESLGNGLKLYGQATMLDNYLGVVGDDQWDNSGNVAYGVAFAWTGSLAQAPVDGDHLEFAYEFDIGLSDNQNAGTSVSWELRAGLFDVCCGPWVPGPYAYPPVWETVAYDNVQGGESRSFSGTAMSSELYPSEGVDYAWAVVLTTYWYDPDAFDGNYQFSSGSGDTLIVTVPMNSIDVGLNAVPNAVPVPAAAWLFGSAVFALGARVRRRAA